MPSEDIYYWILSDAILISQQMCFVNIYMLDSPGNDKETYCQLNFRPFFFFIFMTHCEIPTCIVGSVYSL